MRLDRTLCWLGLSADEGNDEEDEENDEEDPRDGRGQAGQCSEPKYGRDDRHHQKDKCVVKHGASGLTVDCQIINPAFPDCPNGA